RPSNFLAPRATTPRQRRSLRKAADSSRETMLQAVNRQARLGGADSVSRTVGGTEGRRGSRRALMATVATKALRHQQLLQPHSFEGFAAAHILDHSRYQPVPQREHPQAEVGEGTVAIATVRFVCVRAGGCVFYAAGHGRELCRRGQARLGPRRGSLPCSWLSATPNGSVEN